MVEISIVGDRIHFEVIGWDKLWAFKSHLDIPLRHIRAARIDPEAAAGWWHGLRLAGSNIPGVIAAGTFIQSEGIVFYDVHDPQNTIVIELDHEHYKYLVVEVENPHTVLARIQEAIRSRGG